MDERLATVDVARADAAHAVVAVRGEIDLSNAAEVGRTIEQAVAGAAAPVLDLSGIEYMDSQGIRVLHELAQSANERGAHLTIVAPDGTVARDVLRLTRIDELVSLADREPNPP